MTRTQFPLHRARSTFDEEREREILIRDDERNATLGAVLRVVAEKARTYRKLLICEPNTSARLQIEHTITVVSELHDAIKSRMTPAPARRRKRQGVGDRPG